jgi:hypothetical protein
MAAAVRQPSRRRRLGAGLAVAVGAAALGATQVPAAEREPALELVKTRPVTVNGTGFASGERIRVVLRRPSGVSRERAQASPGGEFSSTFSGAEIDRCDRFTIKARGRAGSRATLLHRAPPACGPP